MNQAPTERRETEPTSEIITEIKTTDEPGIVEHVNNELNPEVADVAEKEQLDQPTDLSLSAQSSAVKPRRPSCNLVGCQKIFVHDMLNPDKTEVVPKTGQVIANSYVLDNWYFMTEERNMAAMYSRKQMLDGTFISLKLLSDGTI